MPEWLVAAVWLFTFVVPALAVLVAARFSRDVRVLLFVGASAALALYLFAATSDMGELDRWSRFLLALPLLVVELALAAVVATVIGGLSEAAAHPQER